MVVNRDVAQSTLRSERQTLVRGQLGSIDRIQQTESADAQGSEKCRVLAKTLARANVEFNSHLEGFVLSFVCGVEGSTPPRYIHLYIQRGRGIGQLG